MSKNTMPGVSSAEARAIFAQNIRKLREVRGLSQRDVHHQTGIAQSHISEIETGTSNLAINTMVKLAAVMNIPLWKLFKP